MKNKVFFYFLIFLLSIFFANSVFSQTAEAIEKNSTALIGSPDKTEYVQINFNPTDPVVIKHLEIAFSEKDFDKIVQEYRKVISYLDKKENQSKDEIMMKSAIYALIGDTAVENNEIKTAFLNYNKAYKNLEHHNLNTDSDMALFCIFKIISLAKKTNNTKYYDEYIFTLEKSQLSYAEKYPYLYTLLSDYYKEKGDIKKSEYYKAKSNIKYYATITFGHGQKLITQDKNAYDMLEKAFNAQNYTDKQKYTKIAINYYKNKQELNDNDKKILSSLYLYKANTEKNLGNFSNAVALYKFTYEYMKKNDIHKNFYNAVICLLNLYYISGISNNEALREYTIKEIETTQTLSEPQIMEWIYEVLIEYYSEKENTNKIKHYKKLLETNNKKI